MATIDPERLQRLRYVTVADPARIAGMTAPDFVLAGPQRTGSTWLFNVLAEHPELQLSDPKEIYYWNTVDKPDHFQHVTTELAWYLVHFATAGGRTCGEATASYAAMPDELIENVTTLLPDLRVVITVRHPIERLWSHAKHEFALDGRGGIGTATEDELIEFGNSPYHRRCGMYSTMIEQWSRHLRPGHLHVGLFDDIARRPLEFARDVARFLGVSDDPRHIERRIDHNPNPTPPDASFPERFRPELEALYRDEIEWLRSRFDVPW